MKKSFTEQIKKKKEIEKDEKVRSNIRFKRSRVKRILRVESYQFKKIFQN